MTLPQIGPLGHIQSFKVGTFDIDHQKKLTVPALVRFMQEAAMQNVLRIKLSVWDLESQDLAWILTRQHLQVSRLPQLGETFTVYTQPIGFEKVFTVRDFHVFDQQDELIATSSTTWLLMNTKTRRMSRIPPEILKYQERIPNSVEALPEAPSKLPRVDTFSRKLTYQVNWFDLDFNLHLNNTYYIKWMLEASPVEHLESRSLLELSLLFRAEAQLGETLEARSVVGEHGVLHQLVRPEDGKELALGVSVWG